MFKKISVLTLTLGLCSPVFAKAKDEKRKTASISQRVIFHNTATVKIKDGEVERYLNAAREAKIFALTRGVPEKKIRGERGNISYVAYQSVDNPNLVVFNELWKSKEALNDIHLKTPHMLQFFTAINFNPDLYDIKSEGTKLIFTPKPEHTDYIIAELVLDGFPVTEIR